MIHVENMLLSGDYAPIEYVKSTVDKIVINKRKLTLIKQLENDITKDAIKKTINLKHIDNSTLLITLILSLFVTKINVLSGDN